MRFALLAAVLAVSSSVVSTATAQCSCSTNECVQTASTVVKANLQGGSVCVSMAGNHFWTPAPTISVTNGASGRKNVAITIFSQTGNVGNPVVTIRGSSTTRLGIVSVNNGINGGIFALLSIIDCCTGAGVAEVGQITSAGSPGEVILTNLQVAGNTGASIAGDVGMDAPSGQAGMILDGINLATIAGSIRNGIEIYSSIRPIGKITTIGDFQGNIAFTAATHTNNYLDVLQVGGSIYGTGGAGTTASIVVPSGIFEVNASAINANINGNGNPMARLRVLGNFVGSLNVGTFYAATGRTNPSVFDIDGNADADITISSMQLPLTIDGGLLAGRTVTLGAITAGNNISVSGGVGGRLAISGSLPASTTLTIGGGGIDTAGTVSIGASLAGSIVLPTAGLKGQVFVNANNSTGTWTGSVTVDSLSPISAPTNGEYSLISSTYGGGAIGLAPFFLYRSDCVPQEPAATSAIPPTAISFTPWKFVDETAPVKMRFYGPVRRANTTTAWNAASPGGRAFMVECIPLTNAANPCDWTGTWYNLTTSFVLYGPSTSDTGIAARTLSLGRNGTNSINPGLYRVTFLDVICSGVTGNEPVKVDEYCSSDTATAAYYFRVGMDCNGDRHDDEDPNAPFTGGGCPTGCADRNHNGFAVGDIFDFINDWFAGCTSAGLGNGPNDTSRNCVATADFNGTQGITVQDLFDFLSSWFAGTGC